MKKHSPLRVYFTTSFVTSALYSLIFTVNILYYIFVARLDPLQLVLVGTALEAKFLFEVPTGVVAKQVSITVGLLTSSVLLPPVLPILFAQRKKGRKICKAD